MFINRAITFILLSLLFWATFFLLPPICLSLLGIAIITLIITTEWPHFFNPRSFPFWVVGIPYLIFPLILLIILNHTPDARPLLLLGFITTISFDTVAYLVGSHIGIHKIAPNISAGKTWEGLVGGIIGTVLILTGYVQLCVQNLSLFFTLFFALAVCATAFFGDLFESWLKRRAGIKDSGTLLPGHGGFLDRTDSLLFMIVVVWAMYYLKQSFHL